MKIKLIEHPLLCPACNTRMTDHASQDGQCSSCGIPFYLLTEETKRSGEMMRLRGSWDAVLIEGGLAELGSSRW